MKGSKNNPTTKIKTLNRFIRSMSPLSWKKNQMVHWPISANILTEINATFSKFKQLSNPRAIDAKFKIPF